MAQEKVIMIGVGVITAVLGSLIGYIFYGHIELASEVHSLQTTVEQSESELNDIWTKYNNGQKMFVEHSMEEMAYRVRQAEKWEQFYKEKTTNK